MESVSFWVHNSAYSFNSDLTVKCDMNNMYISWIVKYKWSKDWCFLHVCYNRIPEVLASLCLSIYLWLITARQEIPLRRCQFCCSLLLLKCPSNFRGCFYSIILILIWLFKYAQFIFNFGQHHYQRVLIFNFSFYIWIFSKSVT